MCVLWDTNCIVETCSVMPKKICSSSEVEFKENKWWCDYAKVVLTPQCDAGNWRTAGASEVKRDMLIKHKHIHIDVLKAVGYDVLSIVKTVTDLSENLLPRHKFQGFLQNCINYFQYSCTTSYFTHLHITFETLFYVKVYRLRICEIIGFCRRNLQRN